MADANVLATSVTMSGITVALIQWVKGSKYFPWITKEKIWLLRSFSALSAAGASFGIHYTWTTTDHTLQITGLTLAAVGATLWAFMKQAVMNELVWRITKPTSNPAVVEAVAPQAAREQGIIPEKK
jgi:hypothetical protein